MRRFVVWLGGAVGGWAAYRLLRRRPRVAAEPPPESSAAEPDERAEELRAKLAESRSAEPVAEDAQPGGATVEEVPEPGPEEPESPEDRRSRVHAEGRAALDEMKSD